MIEPLFCEVCHGALTWVHDHKSDLSGIDDGPPDWVCIPGVRKPHKKPEPKSPEVMADIRKRAWETRRTKYGKYGHR